jgi:drug/metabolite transporter (DMT)-like permease
MIAADILLILLLYAAIYFGIFLASHFFNRSPTFRVQMLILMLAAMLGTFLLVLASQIASLQTLAIVLTIILGFCAACLIVAIEIVRQRRLSRRNPDR